MPRRVDPSLRLRFRVPPEHAWLAEVLRSLPPTVRGLFVAQAVIHFVRDPNTRALYVDYLPEERCRDLLARFGAAPAAASTPTPRRTDGFEHRADNAGAPPVPPAGEDASAPDLSFLGDLGGTP